MVETFPIVAEGLVKHFGDIVAVAGVDLQVQPGEVFGFLGPNGAGKSTTVRMLTTLLKPTAGVARVAGFDVATEAAKVRRAIGVALQDAAIDPLMTGQELLDLQAVLHGLPRKDAARRGAELLERVGLTAAKDRRVGTYSGGMRRRLDLALSLVHEPAVLFLDEPTTGLDPTSRLALWDEVRTLNAERGTTVLLTTQYLEEADQLAERIAIIDHGVIVREGVPSQLKAAVGAPTLTVELARPETANRADAVLGRFGERRASKRGTLAIGLAGGSASMAQVVRALDDAGVAVQNLELVPPSLDDVFAEATGRRLEGAGDDEPAEAEADAAEAETAPARGRKRRDKPAAPSIGDDRTTAERTVAERLADVALMAEPPVVPDHPVPAGVPALPVEVEWDDQPPAPLVASTVSAAPTVSASLPASLGARDHVSYTPAWRRAHIGGAAERASSVVGPPPSRATIASPAAPPIDPPAAATVAESVPEWRSTHITETAPAVPPPADLPVDVAPPAEPRPPSEPRTAPRPTRRLTAPPATPPARRPASQPASAAPVAGSRRTLMAVPPLVDDAPTPPPPRPSDTGEVAHRRGAGSSAGARRTRFSLEDDE